MTFIWATRGRTWGFRFLSDAGLDDPRAEYLRRFAGVENVMPAFRRDGDVVVACFPDPLDRRDSAGRVIPHEFVVFSPASDSISSAQDAMRELWPVVQETFDRVWDAPGPPERR
ncbi:MAG: hypothetical protein CMH37_14385 [Microbacterium sp.]|nr:hypothetical protein [Microbacterium sp.]